MNAPDCVALDSFRQLVERPRGGERSWAEMKFGECGFENGPLSIIRSKRTLALSFANAP
jgi:hypothetical protein